MRLTIELAEAQELIDRQAADSSAHGTVDASGYYVGYRLGFPTGYAAYAAAVAAANTKKLADRLTAAMTEQGTVAAAKDLLRSQGEIPF